MASEAQTGPASDVPPGGGPGPGSAGHGLVFPADDHGRRSTSDVGRAVVADALRAADPTGARAAEQETAWRTGYLPHFRRLVEAGLASPEAAVGIARDGLDSLHERMRVVDDTGEEQRLASWPAAAGGALRGVEVVGQGEVQPELVLPFHGERLRRSGLQRRVAAWVEAGVVEPSVGQAVDEVVAHPEWLRLEGHTVAVLGAGAEMGPLPSLMRWGARVAAVDLQRTELWERVLTQARNGAGTLVVPTAADDAGVLEQAAGVDLLAGVPALETWLAEQPGTLVVGNYVYADGATNVRVSMAVDELTRRLLADRGDTALGFLATPTDVFVVPGEAVEHSTRAYDGRSGRSKTLGRPLRTLSGGRLLRRQYVAGSDPGVNDSLVPQQGPNYALAKRLQRWRATVSRHDGVTVSMNVAPPTRTRSVVKNRALAAAYAGAHRFGVEVFEPATSNVLMAALLVHDLHTGGGPRHDAPWQDEAHAAAHGGLWRTAYAPRSALGLAALLGYGAARG
ncbi:hypothetical protein SAMN04488570_1694 [Nocardioides scoriae]|uniref:Uncharacterized protein n=1 Tax=Nocardioides scoriae TaxID=642780 RepID=A0A1H1RI31_9ACTN|nr:hypothetical protein [Nocardioides scoriae]SDS35394.1 hypothetical protein SAMN04488570_1694 [Nocardioides scoriae]